MLSLRRLFIALAGVIVLYSPIELTRLIVLYGYEYELTNPNLFELAWIWLGTLIFIYFWLTILRRQ